MSKRKRRLQMNRRLIFHVDTNPGLAEAKARLDQIRLEEQTTRTPIDPAGFDYEERPRP